MKVQHFQPQVLQQECTICLLPCIKPVKCKGPCQKPFCIKCAAESKETSNRCPNRCSAPFQIEFLQPSTPLRCPYSQDCNITFSAQRLHHNHFQLCLFISPEQRRRETLKKQYKCQNGHLLTFLSGEALEVLYGFNWFSAKESCSECKSSTLCRSLCLQCSSKENKVIYCIDCRYFPCTKAKCPLGHKIKSNKKCSKNRYCDICDVPSVIISHINYGYCKCNLDFCLNCYIKLPEQNELIPLKVKLSDLQRLSVVQEIQSASQWGNDDKDSQWN